MLAENFFLKQNIEREQSVPISKRQFLLFSIHTFCVSNAMRILVLAMNRFIRAKPGNTP